ncbi:hypothetical protein AMTRI_Chr09g39580 [Amborella trichopoda]
MPYHNEVYHSFACEASKQSMQGMRLPLQSNISKRHTAVSTLSHTIHRPLKPPSYTLTAHDPTSCHSCPYARPCYCRACSTTIPSGVTPMLQPVIPSGVT